MPHSEPTRAEAESLSRAALAGFGPCDCHPHGRSLHLCAGHEWLMDDPTRRGVCRQWQRLLFMRSQRAALLFAEGVLRPAPGLPAPLPARAPTILPW